MEHAQIESYWLVKDEGGNVLAINTQKFEVPKLVLTEQSVAPEWYNVLRASGAMYQQLTRQFEALQALIDLTESVGPNHPIIRTFIELQNAILLTQQVAREGVETVGGMLDKQPKLP